MACKIVSNFLHARMTEYPLHIAEAAVEKAVGLVVVEAAVVEAFGADGIADRLYVVVAYTSVPEHVAAAYDIAQSHRCCHAEVGESLFPYYACRHSRIALEAIVVAHDNAFARRCVKTYFAKIFFAVEGYQSYSHAGKSVYFVTLV